MSPARLASYLPNLFCGNQLTEARISPRPLLMVNGSGDRIIPRGSVLALFEAAKEPKDLVWLETGHKVIDESETMPRLIEAVLDWMEAHDLLAGTGNVDPSRPPPPAGGPGRPGGAP
jgi:fermentation-respiration switch protein FrsA (DUF1100 family)